MSVGMVPLPVPPVKAPSANSCHPSPKPFTCHSFAGSFKSSAPSKATATPTASILYRTKFFALNLFADTHPLNPYASILYKNGGREGGVSPPNISLFSNLPNMRKDSCSQNLAAQKSGFVILNLKGDLSTRDETSHLHRSIPEHRAARVGLHQRPAARQIRLVLHRPLTVRGRVAHRQSRPCHHSGYRIPAHPRLGDLAGHGHRLKKSSPQLAHH